MSWNNKNLILFMVISFIALSGCLDKSKGPRPTQKGQTDAPNYQNSFQSQQALLSKSAADQNPVYVAIGGWNSCVQDPKIAEGVSPYGMNMNKEFSKLVTHMNQRNPGTQTKFIIACHTANTMQVRFVSSATPTVMTVGTHEQLYSAIAQFAQTTQSPVVLMGHSYGGDYVMRATSTLPATVTIAQLFTIDGISPISCPATVFMKQASSKIGSLFGQSTIDPQYGLGCTQAPREFSMEQRLAMRSRVGWWQNYYQSDLFSILKSDAIPEACNQTVHHKSISTALNGHIAMGMYDHLWADITNRMTQPIPTQCIDNRL